MTTHLIASAALLGVVGLTGLAVNNYEHNKLSAKPALTVSQVQSQLSKTERELSLTKAVDSINLSTAKAEASQLAAQKAQVCGQLKAVRLTNPACN